MKHARGVVTRCVAVCGFLFAAGLFWITPPAAASAQTGADCRQALALGLDVSGSVDAGEYRLQMNGLAAALEHEDVLRAILSFPKTPVQVSVFEWSGPRHQRLLQNWVSLTDRAAVLGVANRLRATQRIQADPSTGLGAAMIFGQRLLSQQNCWVRTLDISGDGPANTGPRPQDVRHLAGFDGITINGLVIGAGDAKSDLVAYYKELVIHGRGRFVEQAFGFQDYEEAMVRKLLRELQGMIVSQVEPDGSGDTTTVIRQ